MTTTAKKAKNIEEHHDLMRRIRERASTGQTYWDHNWKNAERDLQFLQGNQWPENERRKRENEQRPVITNNMLPAFVDVVIGESRLSRSQIKVLQTGFKSIADIQAANDLTIANVQGTSEYKLADALNALIRQIEYNSDSETAYDTAYENCVSSGLGYLRVYTDWLDEYSFDQHVLIKNIDNQFNVILDPMSTEFDFSDMNWALIDSMMDKDAFKQKYPNANATGDGLVGGGDWYGENGVRVSEYFERVAYTKDIHAMSDGTILDDETFKKIGDERAREGVTIARTRQVQCYKVQWRKVTGRDVLEGPTDLPCSTIPIVPVWGKRLVIKDKKIFRSFICNGLDAQLMSNFFESAATESVSLSPKAPFIASAHHVEGREDDWNNANKETKSVLIYQPMHDADPGPRRQAPANLPAAEITMGMNAVDKIKSTLGMYEASIGAVGNEKSGVAIKARQQQGNKGTFAFIDNLNKAKRRVGKLVVEFVMNTYDGERVEKLRFEDGSEDFVVLNKMIQDEQTKEWHKINDFSVASFETRVDTGPSYATEREESAEKMLALVNAIPEAREVIADLIAENLDIKGGEDIAKRLRKRMPLEFLKADEREKIIKERQEMQANLAENPPPEVQIKQLELQIEQTKLETEKVKVGIAQNKAESDLLKSEMVLESTQVEATTPTEAPNGIDMDQLAAMVQHLVAQSYAEIKQIEQQSVTM